MRGYVFVPPESDQCVYHNDMPEMIPLESLFCNRVDRSAAKRFSSLASVFFYNCSGMLTSSFWSPIMWCTHAIICHIHLCFNVSGWVFHLWLDIIYCHFQDVKFAIVYKFSCCFETFSRRETSLRQYLESASSRYKMDLHDLYRLNYQFWLLSYLLILLSQDIYLHYHSLHYV